MTAPISGQTTVTTAGTEVVLGSGEGRGPLAVRALSTNSGYMYVGNDGAGAVSSSSGYQLSAGDQIIFDDVQNMGTLWVDSSVNGEKVCWLWLGEIK